MYINKYLFILLLFNYIYSTISLEKIPEEKRIVSIKLRDIIPDINKSLVKNLTLDNSYLYKESASGAIPAHKELVGQLDISSLSIPGLPHKKLTYAAALFVPTPGSTPVATAPALSQAEKNAVASLHNILANPQKNILGFTTVSNLSGLTFFCIPLHDPEYKPFSEISLSTLDILDQTALKNIGLKQSELCMYINPANKNYTIYLDGLTKILNIPLTGRVFFTTSLVPINFGPQPVMGLVLQAGIPATWKFSDSFSYLKILDMLEIKKAYIIVSSTSFIASNLRPQLVPNAQKAYHIIQRPTIGVVPGVQITPGISLYGEINLRKILPFLKNTGAFNFETVSLYGTIGVRPSNLLLGAGLPDFVTPNKGPFKSAGTWFEISGASGGLVNIGIIIACVFLPRPQDSPLTLTGRINTDVHSEGITLALTLQGMWDDAFGISGLSIGNVALQLGINEETLVTGIPSSLGFTGSIEVGSPNQRKAITLAALFDATNSQRYALKGTFYGTLSMKEIVDTCEQFAINNIQKVGGDKRALEEINKLFEAITNAPGISQLLSLGFENVEVTLAPDTVRIGEIFVRQGCIIKGACTILGERGYINSSITASGLVGEGSLAPIKIGDFFQLTGSKSAKKYEQEGPLISVALNIRDQHCVISGLVELLGIQQETDIVLDKDGFKFHIDGKLANLFKVSIDVYTHGGIKHPDVSFSGLFQDDFFDFLKKNISPELRKKVHVAVQNIQQTESKVDTLNNKINDLDRQINERQRRINELSGNFIKDMKNSPEIIKLGIEISGLQVAKGTLIASKEVGKGTLKAGEGLTAGLGEATSQILELPEKIFYVKEATISSSFEDLIHSKLPRVKVTYMLFNKQYTIDAQFDFSSQDKATQSCLSLAQQIIKLLGQ